MASAKTPPTTTPDDNLAAFRERSAIANAPAWRPEPGDILTGTLIAVVKVIPEDKDLQPYPKLTYRLDDGSYRAFHAFHGMVREWLSTVRPKLGDKHIHEYKGFQLKNDAKDDKDGYYLYYSEDMANIVATDAETYEF